jgi:molybdopterin-guanine dinucleotide biosynthesis protein A
MPDPNEIAIGAVIAGGQSTRMGNADKLALEFGGISLVANAAKRLKQQLNSVIVNLPKSKAALIEGFGEPVPDLAEGLRGPLAGISASLDYACDHFPKAGYVITCAADTPFFPSDLASKLLCAAGSGNGAAIARCEGFPQPVFGCWPTMAAHDLRAFLEKGETYKVMSFARQIGFEFVDFDVDEDKPHPFFNINTPEDLAMAKLVLAK